MTDVDAAPLTVDQKLALVAELSDDMRILEARTKATARRRRSVMRSLRDDDKVPVARIAERAATSPAAVQATLRIADPPAETD